MEKQGVAFETLDNGFLSCEDAEKLQQTCDRLGSEDIKRLFCKWLDQLPLPLSSRSVKPATTGSCRSSRWK